MSKQERHSERRMHKERWREKGETDGHRDSERDPDWWTWSSGPSSGEGRKADWGFAVKVLRRYKHLDCVGSAEQREVVYGEWKDVQATPSCGGPPRPQGGPQESRLKHFMFMPANIHKRQTWLILTSFWTGFFCLLLRAQINSRRPWPVSSSHNH